MLAPFAVWEPSPNFNAGRKGRQPQFIVIHITDGGPHFDRCVKRFCDPNTKLSPHFVVGRAGELSQLVDTNNRAWHCSGWNTDSIGIEHVARTPGELKNWGTLSLETRMSLLNSGEDPGLLSALEDPGMLLTDVQLSTSAHLVAWLCKQHGWAISRERIRGHCENPASSHRDCGRDVADGGIWPWSDYIDLVIQEAANV